jgi:diguanylate cyclase (GGDEF)-like protein
MKWLDRTFNGKGNLTVPPAGLSRGEAALAEKIRLECEKAATLKRYTKLYMQTLNGTDAFYEMCLRAISALVMIGHLCEEAGDIDVLCRNIMEIFSRELEFENCSIMLTEPDGKHLRLAAGRGKGDKYSTGKKSKSTRRIRIGEGIAGKAAETGEYLFVADVARDDRFKTIAMKVNITSLLSVPVMRHGEVIGVINFSHPLLETFDENRINLMVLLADFVGQMITLARLQGRMADWNETLRCEVEQKTAELVKKNTKLHKIAVTDSLTGLYNRRFFFMRLEEEFSRMLRYDEHFSLLIIDLDNLKPVNDTYGHVMGDRVIKGLAQFLKNMGRKGDTLARIGGDEFAYILVNADERRAHAFALRILEGFAAKKFRGVEIKTTVSIGIADTRMCRFEKYQAIYRAADDALYLAKKKRNHVCIYRENKI